MSQSQCGPALRAGPHGSSETFGKIMKRLIQLLGIVLIMVPVSHAAYSERIRYVLEQLRHCRGPASGDVPMVGGRAIGSAGRPHEFYLLFPYVLNYASDEDLIAMLRDGNPVVRIMGAKCVLNRPYFRLPKPSLDEVLKDKASVFVAPLGCEIFQRTVGEVVAEMQKEPDLLGDETKPNQPPQPPRPTGG